MIFHKLRTMADAYRGPIRVIKILSLFATGMAVILAGFVYDVIFAGIPYQDPSPELLSQYQFHAHIARQFYKVGWIAAVIGLAAIPFLWHFTKPAGIPS